MGHDPPAELAALLSTNDPVRREDAWAALVRTHQGALLHAARSLGGDHDAVMDRFVFVLEHLRADDFRRLRMYAADRRAGFRTWLVVVATRLCLDEYRRRYGRPRGTARRPSEEALWAGRRDLADLDHPLPAESQLVDEGADPERWFRRAERDRLLADELSSLEPADRLLLRLRFDDGLSVPAIASTLGYPSPFHCYRRLQQLFDRLRRRLRARGVEDPVA